jgi:hypothetical protein
LAVTFSRISRSMSVAVKAKDPSSACSSMLERMGMVLRFSTTLCTWPSDLRSAPRSMVSFMDP